jgi:putative ABC transport system permease protein
VLSAGAINWLPFGGLGSATFYMVEGRPAPLPGQGLSADIRGVEAGYFQAMRIRLVAGALLAPELAAGAPRQVVINEALAKGVFAGANPLGQHVLMPWGDTLRGEIVGIVKDVHHVGLDSLPRPMIYWAMPQFPSNFMSVVVRTTGDPMHLAGVLRSAVHEIDATLPLAELRPLEDFLGDSVARRRVLLSILGAFAAAALLLAMVGLYGSLAYTVSQRSQEIGVRMALGARRETVIAMVLREGLGVVGAGAVVGLMISFAATTALGSLLYDVGPRDPATVVLVVAALLLAALAASVVPARRAVRVNPVDALRSD